MILVIDVLMVDLLWAVALIATDDSYAPWVCLQVVLPVATDVVIEPQ